jgi:hypothetical protein
MLPFGVTIAATVPQGSEIPEGLMNNPVCEIRGSHRGDCANLLMQCSLIDVFFFFTLVDLNSQVDFRFLSDLNQFFDIPRYFSPIRNSSLLNICPNTLRHLDRGLPLLLTPSG